MHSNTINHGETEEELIAKGPRNNLSQQMFAVISWGCAATTWLARALNGHPDIFCVHAANTEWSIFGGAPIIDGVRYIRLVGRMGYGHIAGGDVHGVSRDQIPLLREEFGNRFESAVVVRDPIPRLRSQYSLFRHGKLNVWGDLRYVDSIAVRAGLDPAHLTVDERLMIHGTNMLNSILPERESSVVVKSEDLTSSAKALVKFVSHVTRGKVDVGIDWAQRTVSLPRLRLRPDPTDGEITDWQWNVIRHCVLPEAWDAYEELGYRRPAQL